MPNVFMSYARADREVVQQLEKGLLEGGITVWRDQERLYGGQKWPKELGKAIAANDFLLLVWSKNAAQSEYVELEWCTAIALRKTVLPCLLDDTLLPPSLSAIQALNAREPAQAIASILASLPTEIPGAEPARSAEVIRQLGDIPAGDPSEVLKAARAIFAQSYWTVQGSVYQAAGDIHVTSTAPSPAKSDKTLLERWQTSVVLLVGVLIAITLVVKLPGKLTWTIPESKVSENDKQVLDQPLSGSIRDEANDPLPGVLVSLPKFRMTSTTDQFGQFHFQVKAPNQSSVDLMAQKEGYETHETYATLGNTGFSFTMRRKE